MGTKERRYLPSQLWKFSLEINKKYNQHLDTYSDIYNWSIQEPELFWENSAQSLGIEFHQSPNKIVDDVVSMPGTTWFDGAKLNYAQHCLKNRSDEIAIYETNESGEISVVSWNELYNKVSQWVQFFEKNGIKKEIVLQESCQII